jgi:ribonuclease Z
MGRKSDLHIFAHKELENNLLQNIDFYVDEMQYKVVFHPIAPKKHQVIFDDGKITVESLPLKHRIPSTGFLFREKERLPNIRREDITKYSLSLANIASIKGGDDFILPDGEIIPNSQLTYHSLVPRSFAYCSDTAYSEKLIGLVKNVDLLYHEATFAASEEKLAKQTGHSTAAHAAMIALKAGVKKLMIGHFSARYSNVESLLSEAKSIFENTYAVEDGDIFEVAIKRVEGNL